ncbi:unnamed protein product [Rotaria sordida]|uniref:Uncharacterized protein n=1 Tax=Rotaria sordida TaxID=392033 RepID=A0A815EY11_9BILA|nr:unnamed protein product [Rotaria sordida]CAF1583772.1 unnamed protein product [Rotaria sordida]
MDSDLRIDLERSFYLFVKAANNVLSSRNFQPPQVLFALNTVIRRIVEQLIGLIRSDFIPAVNNMIPLTRNIDLLTITRVHKQNRALVEKNPEQLNQLIKIASNERNGKSRNPNSSIPTSTKKRKGIHITSTSHGIKRPRALDLEQEDE